jgi:hypothetical protein
MGPRIDCAHNLEQTAACYCEAFAPRPDDAGIHANLSTALARLCRIADAILQFEIALSIDANLEAVKQNLSAARLSTAMTPEPIP